MNRTTECPGLFIVSRLLNGFWRGSGVTIQMTVFLLLTLLTAGCTAEKPSPSSSAPEVRTPSTSAPMTAAHESTGGAKKSLGPLTISIPAGWVEQAPSSSMRKAQFLLPRTSGDDADGELVAFYFGPGQGGSVEANIDRWVGQFGQPDGSSSKEKAKITKSETAGMTVTFVDLTGTYQAPIMPGA